MIIMPADYVGKKVVEFLCKQKENIRVLVIDEEDRGGYNQEIINLIKLNNSEVNIFKSKDLEDESILNEIRNLSCELGILAWWPHIINESIIKLANRGFVNTHPGFLPYNRGKHPYFWSIVDETPFGVTLHYVDTDIDSGPVIQREIIECKWEDTGESLYNKSREKILELFYDNFEKIKDNSITPLPQIATEGTFHYGKELEPKCNIDLEASYKAKDLINILRGRMFNGIGACSFIDDGKKYIVSINIKEVEGD